MAMNPIQKERNNATIMGAVIGLIIGIIVSIFIALIINPELLDMGSSSKDPEVQVLVLAKDIASGNVIQETDVIRKKVKQSMVPSNAMLNMTANCTAKIDLKVGTVISNSMINLPTESVKADIRRQEYNMISLPTKIKVGDFIDVRLVLPSGQDFIVIAKKRVIDVNDSTVWLNMDEEEMVVMSNAIIEYYIMKGSKLYATTYTDAGLQNQTSPTYVPNAAVTQLISSNVNVAEEKKTDGTGRYINALKALRNSTINSTLSNYDDEGLKNLEEKIQEEIKKLKESRAIYFNNLNGVN